MDRNRSWLKSICKAITFFFIAAVTGFGANFLSDLVSNPKHIKEGSTDDKEIPPLYLTTLEIRESYPDRNNDGKADTIMVEIDGIPDFELAYTLFDDDGDGVFELMSAAVGDRSRPRLISRRDADGDGAADEVFFMLNDDLDLEKGITYYYRDLDLNGRIDMLSLRNSAGFGFGYIISGTRWYRYEKIIDGEWRQVEMETKSGDKVMAVFEGGTWHVEGVDPPEEVID